MIRLWLSRRSPATLREQLATQLMLGVVSGELGAGEKLPSVRELARRYDIHSNTVSAAYRDLTARGWLEMRKGSGLYVRGQDASAKATGDGRGALDRLIEGFLAETRSQGFAIGEVRARLAGWLGGGQVERLVIAEPEPELGEVLRAELAGAVRIPVSTIPLGDGLAGGRLRGAAVASLASRAHQLRTALPPGVPHHLLRPPSLAEYIAGQQRPSADALIGVASASPDLLGRVRTLLAAVGLEADALEFRDAREPGWRRGLTACRFVICDVVTGRKLPPGVAARQFRVVSESSIAGLRRFLELVTDPKVS